MPNADRWNGEMPRRMAELPTDKAGHPVPWFVAFIDGRPAEEDGPGAVAELGRMYREALEHIPAEASHA